MGAARRCGASAPSLRHMDSEPARRRPRLEIEWALRRWGSGPPLSATLEHDPEKWAPVFPRDKREAFARRSCSNKKTDWDDDSKKRHPNLGESTGQARRHGFEHRWHRKV